MVYKIMSDVLDSRTFENDPRDDLKAKVIFARSLL